MGTSKTHLMVRRRGERIAACEAELGNLAGFAPLTGDPHRVTCGHCRTTNAYLDALVALQTRPRP
jgi:hypothetical protein